MTSPNFVPVASSKLRHFCSAVLGVTLCFSAMSAGALPPLPPINSFHWVRILSGSPTFGSANEVAQSVTFDSKGNVVTAGATIGLFNGSNEKAFTVAKWSPTGEREWARTLPASSTWDDTAWAVKTDEEDHVIAAGRSANAENDSEFTVARWDSDGNLNWRTTLDLGEFLGSTAFAMALAPGGDVIAVGSANNSPEPGALVVVRLDADLGDVKWTKVIGGSQTSFARAVAVDRKGHVLVGGRGPGSDGVSGASVHKLDGVDGELLWSQDLTSGQSDQDSVRSLQLNGRGDVIAGGMLQGRFAVVRLNAETGRLRWHRIIQGPAGPGVGEALSVALDKNGHAVVGGYSSDSVFTVAKLHGESGVPLWTRLLLGPAPDYRLYPGRANAVTVDYAGRVTAIGYRTDTSIPDSTFYAEIWDASGRPVGSRFLNGDISSPTDEEGLAAAVSPAGNIAVAGSIVNSGTGVDFTVAYIANEEAPRLRASRKRIAFSPTRVGSRRKEELVLTNVGHAVWNGTIESSSSAYSLAVAGEPPPPEGSTRRTLSIEPGQRLRLEIWFVPTAPGKHAGKLYFSFDAIPFPQFEVAVSGVARAATR